MLPRNLQSLTPNAFIELWEWTDFKLYPDPVPPPNPYNPYDPPAPTTPDFYRFCNFSDVAWRETPAATPHEYLAIGCEGEGFEVTGQGAMPQPKLTISNVGRMLSDFLFTLKYNPQYRLEGSTVIRHVTQVNFLEGAPDYLAPARELPQHIYEVEQLEEETPAACRFILAGPFELDGATLPGRPAIRTCPYLYRDPGTCGYNGDLFFTRSNQPTSNRREDICNRSLPACELRHPTGLLPFGGYPGLGGF